ncbi:Protein Mis18-alpha [Sorochytrium milnesiophthora]
MLTLGDIESSPYILVMQCRHCKSIVGDSTAWWASCPRLAMVALFARHDNVALEATMAASTGGTDVGCSFWWLHCRSCLTHIGKRYETTRKEFDYVRDMFCYWVDRIIWYRVGSFVNEPGAVVTNEEVFSLPSTVAIARELALLKNEINLLRASATGQPGQATPPSTASLSKESPVLQQQQMMPPRASDAAAAMHKGKATVRNERKLVATGPQRVAPSVPAVTTQQHPPLQNLSAADLTQRINHAAQHQRQTVEMQDLLRRQAAYTRADEPAKSGTPPTSPTSSPKAAATTSTAIAKPANLRSATEDDLPVESPRGKRDGSVVSVGSQDSNASTVSSAGKRFMPVIEISGRPEKRRNLGNDKSVPGGATDTDADTAPTATSAATTTTTTSLDTVAEPQNAARPSSSLNPAKGSFFSKWVRQGSLSQKGAVPAPSRPPKFTFNKSIPKPTTAPSTTATTTTAESKDAPNPLQNTVRKAVDVVVVEDDSDSEEEGQLS